MKKIEKIFITVLYFILIMSLLCFSISIINTLIGNISYKEIPSKTILYFLYLIGYGSLEGDTFLQNILAIVGIVSLALLSTYLTINLFWRLDDVKIDKNVLFKEDKLYFNFLNKGKNICDFKVSFLLYDKDTKKSINSEEYSIPFIFSKSEFLLDININEYFWYHSIYSILTTNKELYSLYSFVDTTNGQSSIKMDKIDKEYLTNIDISYFKKDILFTDVKMASNNGSIEYKDNYYIYKLDKNDSFVMSYISFKDNIFNIKRFTNMNKVFSFNIKSDDNINMTIEFKNMMGTIYSKDIVVEGNTYIEIPLKEIIDKTDNLYEVCFTIFGNNKRSGKYILNDIKVKEY